jgi:molybdate transport system substrate-binding protein
MQPMISTSRTIAGAALILLAVVAPAPGHAEELLVSAAASLANAFKDIGQAFEAAHPATKVAFNFAASDVLLQQIAEGAPADIFASADPKSMDKAAMEIVIDQATRADFARNVLVLGVPADAKSIPSNLADLKQAAIRRIAISQPATVPVGRYAKAALDQAHLWGDIEDKFIYTQNVRQSLDYAARGEVDAAFLYATDAAIMKEQVRIAFEVPTPSPVVYPIAVVRRTKHPALSRSFLDFVRAKSGQDILEHYGFAKP